MKKITVKQDPEKEVPIEVMAEAITSISLGIKKLLNGPLNRKAIVMLIQGASPSVGGRYGKTAVGRTEIEAVIEGMVDLEATYLKKK